MKKVFEVMTRTLATCSPDASVSNVATIMRDRNIGNVLVVKDGKLHGIVTDRDLTLQALTGEDNPLQLPISQFMSTRVVTGDAEWSLEQAARVMARHQVRRLPIVKSGQLVGIISLGDVALHEEQTTVVKESLEAISAPVGLPFSGHALRSGAIMGVALAAVATSVLTWFTFNQSGQAAKKQLVKSDLYHSAQQAVNTAIKKVDEVRSSQSVRDLSHQLRSSLNDLSAQLSTLEYKPPKQKQGWFS
jgi:CBS domain-containing protein